MNFNRQLLPLFLALSFALSAAPLCAAQDGTQDDISRSALPASGEKGLTGIGIGWWHALGPGSTANGAALSWSTPHFLVSGGFDGKSDGFITAGPGLPVEWSSRAGRFRIPLHALVGVTRFGTGVLDYGAAAGLLWAGSQRAGAGVLVQVTRHNFCVTLNIVF